MVFPKRPEYARIPNTIKTNPTPANTEYILESEKVENNPSDSTIYVAFVDDVKKSRSNSPLRSKNNIPVPAKNGMLII